MKKLGLALLAMVVLGSLSGCVVHSHGHYCPPPHFHHHHR